MTMSGELPSGQPMNQRLLDRLVDGELDATGRRALLNVLDDQPGGWRQCALAFLEAQAWRNDLRGAVRGSLSVTAPATSTIARPRSRAVLLRQAGLIVAALIVAFGAGWLIRPGDGRRQLDPGRASPPVARHVPYEPTTPQAPIADIEKPDPEERSEARQVGTLTLEVEDHGQQRTLQVPVIDGPKIDRRWLLEHPPALRTSVVQALERRGYTVEAHRQLVTVNLKDGRKLILPVDEVDVRFAGRVFQ
jgi:hypothetical protein